MEIRSAVETDLGPLLFTPLFTHTQPLLCTSEQVILTPCAVNQIRQAIKDHQAHIQKTELSISQILADDIKYTNKKAILK